MPAAIAAALAGYGARPWQDGADRRADRRAWARWRPDRRITRAARYPRGDLTAWIGRLDDRACMPPPRCSVTQPHSRASRRRCLASWPPSAGTWPSIGYWAILLFVMLEDFGVPLPGETILIAGRRRRGRPGGSTSWPSASSASSPPSSVTTSASRSGTSAGGRWRCAGASTSSSPRNGWTRRSASSTPMAARSSRSPGSSRDCAQANGIIAGISGMRWLRFLAFNALGAALWVGCWVSVGYFGGQHITTIYDYITQYSLLRADRARGRGRRLDRAPLPPPRRRGGRRPAGSGGSVSEQVVAVPGEGSAG